MQQAPRQAGLLAQMERQEQARRAFVAEQTAAAEKARAEQEAREREDAARARNGDITDAKNRYAQALGDEYDIRDPYASLARAAMNEYGRFAKQQEALTQQIAEAKTPEDRRTLELRKEIEGCEYMVITSHRLAGISRAITGNVNSEQAQRDEAKAKFYQERAAELRAERAEIEKGGTGTESGEGKAPPREAAAKASEKPTATPAPKPQDRQPEALAASRAGRAGEPPKTAADHEAVNRTQAAEKKQREEQGKTDRSARTEGRSTAEDAATPRKESRRDRAERLGAEARGAAQEKGHAQGRDGGGGRGGGGNSR